MYLLTLVLGLSIFLGLTFKAVKFQQATVCRQDAWLKSVELKTQNLLTRPQPHAVLYSKKCHVVVNRQNDSVFWRRLPQLKTHKFLLPLKGKL